MERMKYYKNLFFIGAIWNWAMTTPFFFFYKPIFSFLGMKEPVYPGNLQLFLALAFIFGLGYYWVSRDLENNDNIVKMGILGKTAVFVLMMYYVIIGNVHWIMIFPGVGDLIFAGFFVEFLLYKKKA